MGDHVAMERFLFWFASFNLIGSSIGWVITQLTNKTEPPIVLALSWYAVWQGALIFLITAHIDNKRREKEESE